MKHETPRLQGFILDFILDKAQRGKGYGKSSLLALEEFAKGMGLETLMLNVFTQNTPAMKLYKGFVITSYSIHYTKLYENARG